MTAAATLRVLKAGTPHGEFTKRCAEAFYGDQKLITDEHLKTARVRAHNYMRLFEQRDAWQRD